MGRIPDGTFEVVRYIGKEPHDWVTRGTLCRVIKRANGKVRVTKASGKAGGSPQYIPESEVETVGTFDGSSMFGMAAGSVETKPPEPIQDEPVADPLPIQAECTENVPISDPTTTPMDLGLAVKVDDPPDALDIRELIRDEIKRQLREMVAEMVRQEIACYFGTNG